VETLYSLLNSNKNIFCDVGISRLEDFYIKLTDSDTPNVEMFLKLLNLTVL